MNKEEGIKLNNAFDEFCQNFNIKSALAYFATADGESVALAFHNVTDAEIENLIGNLVGFKTRAQQRFRLGRFKKHNPGICTGTQLKLSINKTDYKK